MHFSVLSQNPEALYPGRTFTSDGKHAPSLSEHDGESSGHCSTSSSHHPLPKKCCLVSTNYPSPICIINTKDDLLISIVKGYECLPAQSRMKTRPDTKFIFLKYSTMATFKLESLSKFLLRKSQNICLSNKIIPFQWKIALRVNVVCSPLH